MVKLLVASGLNMGCTGVMSAAVCFHDVQSAGEDHRGESLDYCSVVSRCRLILIFIKKSKVYTLLVAAIDKGIMSFLMRSYCIKKSRS